MISISLSRQAFSFSASSCLFRSPRIRFEYLPHISPAESFFQSLDALVTRDVEQARELFLDDELVDKERNKVYKLITSELNDQPAMPPAC
ncbi:MAG: PhoU domain-containing protein [Thermodesulfobacteriota bacterium]|nr:PhoU domain-containing protein [Thermodesulfobacteriota bacterium]